MLAPSEEHPRAASRGRGRLLLLAGVGACVLVLVGAVAGLAGALDELPPPELPVAVEDEVNEGEPWNVTVVGAALAADLEPAILIEDGYWLAVIAEVEITADQSRDDIRNVLYVTGVEGLAREHYESDLLPGAVFADDVRMVRDGTEAESLHPGMVERLAYLWELAADTAPPAEVEVKIVGMTLRENSFSGHLEWFDEAPRARLTVSVVDRRDEDTGDEA